MPAKINAVGKFAKFQSDAVGEEIKKFAVKANNIAFLGCSHLQDAKRKTRSCFVVLKINVQERVTANILKVLRTTYSYFKFR